MYQPSKWWWGLVPLALVWVLANWIKAGPIKLDIQARSQAAASAAAPGAPGARPVFARVAGRDVTISGEVQNAATITTAANAADAGFGVRRVSSSLTQVAAVKPYIWSATRDAGKLTLSGVIPGEDVRKANLDAASKAFPGLAVDDQQKIGFGATPGFAALTAWALPELARLREGVVSVTDGVFTLSGRGPAEFAACAALQAQSRVLPAGNTLGKLEIECPSPPPPPPAPPPPPPPAPAPVAAPAAPVVVPAPAPQMVIRIDPPDVPPPPPPPAPPPQPLEWTAIKSAGGIALSGVAPNEAAKALAKTNAAGIANGPVLDDAVRLLGIVKDVPNYAQATQFALAQLRLLVAGEARLRDTVLSVSGAAPTPAIRASVEQAMQGRLPDGLTAASASITIRPYVFQARSEKGVLILEGLVPDLETKNALLALAEASAFKGKVTDTMMVVGGAPVGMGETARLAVQSLLRMDDGATRIVDSAVTFYGTTCKAGIKDIAETALKVNLASGYTSSALVDVKKAAECRSCTEELAKVEGRAILFQQAKAEVATDPATSGILDQVATILKTCPAARIEIEAHTNNDGEARGFDNIGLSDTRAKAVLAALVQRGIPAAQLQAVGRGSTKPIQPHGTPGAREKNRRIDFNVKSAQ